MEQAGDTNLIAAFKKLMAESKSQQARLEESAQIIYGRDNEIEMLHTMLTEANEYRSSTDARLKELSHLQSYINGLKLQADESVYMVTGNKTTNLENISIDQQFEKLKQEYAYLQTQLTDLQTQLLEANNRNTILQLNASRVAELESVLANAEEEIGRLKQRASDP